MKEWSGLGPGCPGRWWSPHPWRGSKNVWMWHFRTGFSRHGGVGLAFGLGDLRGLFQPMILWSLKTKSLGERHKNWESPDLRSVPKTATNRSDKSPHLLPPVSGWTKRSSEPDHASCSYWWGCSSFFWWILQCPSDLLVANSSRRCSLRHFSYCQLHQLKQFHQLEFVHAWRSDGAVTGSWGRTLGTNSINLAASTVRVCPQPIIRELKLLLKVMGNTINPK